VLPHFFQLARDWRDAADRLRAAGVPERHPLLGVWREAAWCHLMFSRGRPEVALARLRAVVREVTGNSPRGERVERAAAATDLFTLLREAASARYRHAFHPLAAA